MSEENVKIVRAVYDAFQRRDTESPFEFYAADIEWDLSPAMLDGGTVHHGHEGVRNSFRDLLGSFSAIDFDVEEVIEAEDRVLATIRERYIGRTSEVEVDRRHYAVWTLQIGKVTHMRVYLDRDEALEAAGLSG